MPNKMQTSFPRQEPKFVHDRLQNFCSLFEQDIERLRKCWRVVDLKLWPNHDKVSAVDYLRSQLIIFYEKEKTTPESTTAGAWRPFILEYCRTLGVDPIPVDRFYQRLVVGDLTDERVVEFEAQQGIGQLRTAMGLAKEQWFNGKPIIGCVTAGVAGETQFLKVTLEQMSWLVGEKPAKGTIGNKLRADPTSPKAINPRKGVEDVFLYRELVEWFKTAFPATFPRIETVAIEHLRNRPQLSNR